MVGVEQAKNKGLRGLFDDLSIAQVLAGALAAVTSMLLASQIGIYGSVIGVAVGSMVSAVASQVYKKFLSASAEKLRAGAARGASGVEGEGGDSVGETRSMACERDDAAGSARPSARGAGDAAKGDAGDTDEDVSPLDASSFETMPIAPVVAGVTRRASAVRAEADVYADAARMRARAARQRKAKMQQRVLLVSVVSALVAVMLCAGVISFVTAGQGVGAKPQHFVSSNVSAPAEYDGTASSNDNSPASPQESSSVSSETDSSPSQNPSDNATNEGEQSSGGGSHSGVPEGPDGGDAESGSGSSDSSDGSTQGGASEGVADSGAGSSDSGSDSGAGGGAPSEGAQGLGSASGGHGGSASADVS